MVHISLLVTVSLSSLDCVVGFNRITKWIYFFVLCYKNLTELRFVWVVVVFGKWAIFVEIMVCREKYRHDVIRTSILPRQVKMKAFGKMQT